MQDLSLMTLNRLLWRRAYLQEEIAATSPHLTPLLYYALETYLDDINEELSRRAQETAEDEPAEDAGQPARRVALRRNYDEKEPLDEQLEELGTGQRFGY